MDEEKFYLLCIAHFPLMEGAINIEDINHIVYDALKVKIKLAVHLFI